MKAPGWRRLDEEIEERKFPVRRLTKVGRYAGKSAALHIYMSGYICPVLPRFIGGKRWERNVKDQRKK
jgi:hypothetical protein